MGTGLESSVAAIAKKFGVGGILEAVGVVVFFIGVVQLLHHGAIAACVVGGVAAYFTGKKFRTAS